MNMMEHNFVICTSNGGYEASLELRKLYEILPDVEAERRAQVRIVDESGEDYLCPASFFTPINLPSRIADQLLNAA
jgi:hypothetical protein